MPEEHDQSRIDWEDIEDKELSIHITVPSSHKANFIHHCERLKAALVRAGKMRKDDPSYSMIGPLIHAALQSYADSMEAAHPPDDPTSES